MEAAAGGAAVADASGSGAGDGVGDGADAGAGGTVSRRAINVGSYFGLIPSEHSSGGRQQMGRISKQGSSFLRFLLVEAGQSAARYDAELGRFYRRLAVRKHRGLAKVAVARKLATRLYLMLREEWDIRATVQGSRAGEPESFCGRKVRNRPLEWAAGLPEERGVRSGNHGNKSRRDGWWDSASAARFENTSLGRRTSKPFCEREMGANTVPSAKSEVSPKMP